MTREPAEGRRSAGQEVEFEIVARTIDGDQAAVFNGPDASYVVWTYAEPHSPQLDRFANRRDAIIAWAHTRDFWSRKGLLRGEG